MPNFSSRLFNLSCQARIRLSWLCTMYNWYVCTLYFKVICFYFYYIRCVCLLIVLVREVCQVEDGEILVFKISCCMRIAIPSVNVVCIYPGPVWMADITWTVWIALVVARASVWNARFDAVLISAQALTHPISARCISLCMCPVQVNHLCLLWTRKVSTPSDSHNWFPVRQPN